MHDPKNDPLEKIVVTLGSGKIHRRATLKRHGDAVGRPQERMSRTIL